MAKVIWEIKSKGVANAATADHFRVTLGVLEADEPLTSNSHDFGEVEPGEYQAAVACVDAAGNELAPPVVSAPTPIAGAPIPVTVTIQG